MVAHGGYDVVMAASVGELRVDDLARTAGVATTTVRLYHSKGLLPPPRLDGRTGYYGQEHLDRLQAIARLQADGFSLAGIKALIDRWEDGGDLDDLLGAEGHVEQILGVREPVSLRPDELLARFPPESLDMAAIQRAGAMGLLEVAGDGTFLVPDVRSLDTGAALAQMGVPLGAVLDEWEALQAATDDLAARFAALFETYLLPDESLADMEPASIEALAGTLVELKDRGGRILLASFEDSLRRVAAERFGDLVDGE